MMTRATRTATRKSISTAASSRSPPLDEKTLDDKALSHWERALKSLKFVGAHVSAAGGPQNSIPNAQRIGGTALALFLTSQRKWEGRQLTPEEVTEFKEAQKQSQIEHILPHGSYLVNLGNPNEEVREKSFKAFLQDLKRCERLGVSLYNFHPGSSLKGGDPNAAMGHIASAINRAHKETERVVIVLENMAGQGSVLGSTFEQLSHIIDKVILKDRVGVCLDTCHSFAAGYDISTYDSFAKVMNDFDTIVGLKYLKAMHLNDSKGELGCHTDRHENIGKGKIGLEAFKFIMNNSAFNDMPLILETPIGKADDVSIWEREIDLLYSLVEQVPVEEPVTKKIKLEK